MANIPKENNRGNRDLPANQKILRTAEAGIHANIHEPINREEGNAGTQQTTGGVNPRT